MSWARNNSGSIVRSGKSNPSISKKASFGPNSILLPNNETLTGAFRQQRFVNDSELKVSQSGSHMSTMKSSQLQFRPAAKKPRIESTTSSKTSASVDRRERFKSSVSIQSASFAKTDNLEALVARAKEMTTEFIYLSYAYPQSDVRFSIYSLV